MSKTKMINYLASLIEDVEDDKVNTLTIINNSKTVDHLAKFEYDKETTYSDIISDCKIATDKITKKVEL